MNNSITDLIFLTSLYVGLPPERSSYTLNEVFSSSISPTGYFTALIINTLVQSEYLHLTKADCVEHPDEIPPKTLWSQSSIKLPSKNTDEELNALFKRIGNIKTPELELETLENDIAASLCIALIETQFPGHATSTDNYTPTYSYLLVHLIENHGFYETLIVVWRVSQEITNTPVTRSKDSATQKPTPDSVLLIAHEKFDHYQNGNPHPNPFKGDLNYPNSALENVYKHIIEKLHAN